MAEPRPRQYRDGRFRFKRVGVPLRRFADVYHFLLKAPAWILVVVTFIGYLLANALFALLYLLDPGGVTGLEPGHFGDAFWFSVQTMSTIGFGAMSPVSWWANLVVTVESYVGLAAVAVGTGVLFAKISRPTSRVDFSDVMVVYRRDGVPCLVFRLANQRNNQIVEARISVSALVDEQTLEGEEMRRLRDLPLERRVSPLFTLTWSVIHPLDEHSPIMQLPDGPRDSHLRGIIVTLAGTDDTFSQTVHARHTYTPDSIRVGFRFGDMITDLPDGRLQVDHRRLSDVIACGVEDGMDLPGAAAPPPAILTEDAREAEEERIAVEADEATGPDDDEGEAA